MPELPEVETVRRGLERTIVGKTIESVEVRVRKLFPDDPALIERVLVSARVRAVERRAKVLLVELSSNGMSRTQSRDWTLAIHLKMTGQLVVAPRKIRNSNIEIRNKSEMQNQKLGTVEAEFVGGHPENVYEQPLPHKHTHVIITFTDGTMLYFNDLRKFGWMKLLRGSSGIKNEELRMKNTKRISMIPTVDAFIDRLGLGPEPLGPEFTAEYLRELLKDRKIPIKQLLLGQKGIAGVGNIYADEALFYAGVHPRRVAAKLTKARIGKLYDGIRHVLQLGIEHGGTTLNTYRTVEGTAGKMREHLKIYGREGEPCFVCGQSIERIKIGQRSSYFCPRCQD